MEKVELTEDNASKLEEFSKEWKDANDKWNDNFAWLHFNAFRQFFRHCFALAAIFAQDVSRLLVNLCTVLHLIFKRL